MRLALVGIIAVAGLAPMAQAQTPETAPAAAAPMTPAPQAAAPQATTPADQPASAAPAPAAPEAPAAPPPPPTDPTAIAVLNTVEHVCMPAADGGNLAQVAKASGFRKSGDNFVYKQPTFQLTIEAPGSNPNLCHIDIVHPVYPEGPARPLVVALHNWAVFGHDWDLYQNNKQVAGGQEFSVRSWEHTQDGKRQALVLTTIRKGDGTPAKGNADTSEVLYSVVKN